MSKKNIYCVIGEFVMRASLLSLLKCWGFLFSLLERLHGFLVDWFGFVVCRRMP